MFCGSELLIEGLLVLSIKKNNFLVEQERHRLQNLANKVVTKVVEKVLVNAVLLFYLFRQDGDFAERLHKVCDVILVYRVSIILIDKKVHIGSKGYF